MLPPESKTHTATLLRATQRDRPSLEQPTPRYDSTQNIATITNSLSTYFQRTDRGQFFRATHLTPLPPPQPPPLAPSRPQAQGTHPNTSGYMASYRAAPLTDFPPHLIRIGHPLHHNKRIRFTAPVHFSETHDATDGATKKQTRSTSKTRAHPHAQKWGGGGYSNYNAQRGRHGTLILHPSNTATGQ